MMRKIFRLVVLLGALALVGSVPAFGATPQFTVLAFYSGTYDAAHISFEKEANMWFPQIAAQYDFSYQSTTDWSRLDSITPSQYQVVMFLDDLPQSADERAGFQRYMASGGGFFGFHVSAFNTDPSTWDWYHNQFLGTGAFVSNTWGPTTAVLKVETQAHPATRRLPVTYVSGVSEWYSWANDLRKNPNIQILASVDPSSFPLGTDPNQSWTSGYYPIMWTNKNYKMLYANFGHNWMNYDTNTALSATFADPVQNEFVIDGLLWLGGGAATNAPADPISPSTWFTIVDKDGKCVDARAAATGNGTAIQQYTCNGTNAQEFQLQNVGGPYLKIVNRNDATKGLDVTNVSTADGAPIQLWSYVGGANQQWQAVPDGGGYYHLVNRNSNSTKCLTVPGSSTADSVQLVQQSCTGIAAQSFHLVAQP
ncbi:MAG TPA: RICIN domain-containing protein [Pseudonocardiaceae bacterium]|nr:RICIN domain-containing protein [Pseudonocardiaceae bacterium]